MVNFSLVNTTSVSVTLPHFWKAAGIIIVCLLIIIICVNVVSEFDPHYSVLTNAVSESGTVISYDECGNPISEQNRRKNKSIDYIITMLINNQFDQDIDMTITIAVTVSSVVGAAFILVSSFLYLSYAFLLTLFRLQRICMREGDNGIPRESFTNHWYVQLSMSNCNIF